MDNSSSIKKNILIITSSLLTLSLFLPFIGNYSLYDIFNVTHTYLPQVNTSGILLAFITFIMASWFITISYGKENKLQILGIIGSIIYIYTIINVANYSGMDITGNVGVLDVIIYCMNTEIFGKVSGIGMYILFIGFLVNSFGIINIIVNTLVIIGNRNHHSSENNIENKDNSKSEILNDNDTLKTIKENITNIKDKILESEKNPDKFTYSEISIIILIFIVIIYFIFKIF